MTPTTTITRRRLLQRGGLAAAAFAAVPVLAACGDDEQEPAATATGDARTAQRVPVGVPAGGADLAVWKPVVAALKLTNPNAEIEWVHGDPGQLQTQFLAGATRITAFGPIGAAQANLSGTDVRLVGPGVVARSKWLAKGSSRYRSLDDLRGRKIVLPLATSEVYRQAAVVYQVGGGSFADDFEIVHAAGAAAVALFEKGEVEAIFTNEPTATRLVAGGANEIAVLEDQFKEATGLDVSPFSVGQGLQLSWARENKDAAAGVVDIITRANQAVVDDPSLLEQVATEIGVTKEESDVAALLPERMPQGYGTTFADDDFKVIDLWVELAVKQGILEKAPAEPVYAKLAEL